MSDIEESIRQLEALKSKSDQQIRESQDAGNKANEAIEKLKRTVDEAIKSGDQFRRLTVNKRTHRIRFENETESEVTIVVEKKEDNEHHFRQNH